MIPFESPYWCESQLRIWQATPFESWRDEAIGLCDSIRTTSDCRSSIVKNNFTVAAQFLKMARENLDRGEANMALHHVAELHQIYIRVVNEEAMFCQFSDQDLIRQASKREPGQSGDRGRHKRIAKRVRTEFGIDVSIANVKKALAVKK